MIASPVSDSKIIDQQSPHVDQQISRDFTLEGSKHYSAVPNKSFLVCLSKLVSSHFQWGKISKSRSPRISGSINNIYAPALIDSGADINVMDAHIAERAGIGIKSTTETAQAANNLPLKVCGQTTSQVQFNCNTQEGNKMLNLGFILVVQNLGVACLIGEPGKQENNIICLPKKKLIILGNGTAHHTPYLSSENEYVLAKAIANQTLKPNEGFSYKLPAHLAHASHVAVTPRQETLNWIEPRIYQVTEGFIYLVNTSPGLVHIKKSSNMADIRGTQIFLHNVEPYLGEPNKEVDKFQFTDLSTSRKDCH